MMLSAPTRSGKGVGVVIPSLLNWPDSGAVLDIKGREGIHSLAVRRPVSDCHVEVLALRRVALAADGDDDTGPRLHCGGPHLEPFVDRAAPRLDALAFEADAMQRACANRAQRVPAVAVRAFVESRSPTRSDRCSSPTTAAARPRKHSSTTRRDQHRFDRLEHAAAAAPCAARSVPRRRHAHGHGRYRTADVRRAAGS